MDIANPFTERGRITDPQHFAGRWAELSQIVGLLERGRPVLLSGVPGIGVSSLLTHLMQSAAATLEEPTLRSYFIDLATLQAAADCYQLICRALGHPGNDRRALVEAVEAAEAPVLLCLDNVGVAAQAGWGAWLLEELARAARTVELLIVAGSAEPTPILSEPYAPVGLGAFAAAEIRLFFETYLDGTGVSFTPEDAQAIFNLTRGHPAYVQRAAYHLFRSKLEPGYRWRGAYLLEAKQQPVPGAPLPPQIFAGEDANELRTAQIAAGETVPDLPPPFATPDISALPWLLLPLLIALLVYLLWR